MLLAGLTGCVQVEQDLVLNPDGSGTLKVVYGVKEQDLQRMRQLAAQMAAIDPSLAPKDVDWLTAFDEEVIRTEWAKVAQEGVALRSVATSQEGGWRFMTADISFVNLQRLFECGMIKDCHIALTRGPGGQYGYQQSVDVGRSLKSLPAGMDMATLQPMLGMMLKEFKAEFRISVPGDILRTNADRTEGRQAVWSMHGGQADLAKRLQELDLRLMFDGKNLRIADAQSL